MSGQAQEPAGSQAYDNAVYRWNAHIKREIGLGTGNGGPGSGHVAFVDAADYELVSQYSWCAAKRGTLVYAQRKWQEHGKWHHLYMHDLIMGVTGVDHRDGNGLNNQRQNLRVADQSRNSQNMHKPPARTATSSRYKGVCWYPRKGKWRAQITTEGKRRHLGIFDSEEEAARTYDRVARAAFGEFARLNFPLPSEQGVHREYEEPGATFDSILAEELGSAS
jgi:hypothetical protein